MSKIKSVYIKKFQLLFLIAGATVVLFAMVVFHWDKINHYLNTLKYTLTGENMVKNSVLFLWKIDKETEQTLDTYQSQLHINRIFQYISPIEFKEDYLETYILERNTNHFTVYSMDGAY